MHERADARKRRLESEAAATADAEWGKWAAEVQRLSQLDEWWLTLTTP